MRVYISITIFLFFLIFSENVSAQTYYWVAFKNKTGTQFTIDKPEEFLSDRAIERRARQNIPIVESDLPISPNYRSAILELGAELAHTSRWLNGITVKTDSVNFSDKLDNLDFVREYQVTKNQYANKSVSVNKFGIEDGDPVIDSAFYGAAVSQIAQINGHYLHQMGFKGQGMHIAVLDAGFTNSNQLSAFEPLWQNNQVLGTKDFVNKDAIFFANHHHGTYVLSIMAANLPGQLIGTAPEASYWLIRTEDAATEYLIEEDNWVAGAEFADSAGVDIINTSLGYSDFDDPSMNHTYQDMDGNSTRITIAADMAASKGILVFSSAGNSGNDGWHYITAPSDGDSVICVGAVNSEGTKASFSSFGPASDGAIKPNVSAMGWGTAFQNTSGMVATGNGTSFSSPVMAGMGACLWQAFPEFKSMEIKGAIEESAHQFLNPDSLLGYGIPDFKVASQILKSREIIIEELDDREWQVAPNPFNDQLVLQNLDFDLEGEVKVYLYNGLGVKYFSKSFSGKKTIILDELNDIPPGLVILLINSQQGDYSYKLIKKE